MMNHSFHRNISWRLGHLLKSKLHSSCIVPPMNRGINRLGNRMMYSDHLPRCYNSIPMFHNATSLSSSSSSSVITIRKYFYRNFSSSSSQINVQKEKIEQLNNLSSSKQDVTQEDDS